MTRINTFNGTSVPQVHLPIGDPWDGFFYPTPITLMEDSYNLKDYIFITWETMELKSSSNVSPSQILLSAVHVFSVTVKFTYDVFVYFWYHVRSSILRIWVMKLGSVLLSAINDLCNPFQSGQYQFGFALRRIGVSMAHASGVSNMLTSRKARLWYGPKEPIWRKMSSYSDIFLDLVT